MTIFRNRLLSAASSTFVLYILNAGLTFLIGLLLARLLGADGLGIYDYADAWVEIAHILALVGFDRLLVRKIPVYSQDENWQLVAGIWRGAARVGILVAGFTIIGSAMFFIWRFTSDTPVLLTTLLALMLLPIRLLIRLQQSVIHGFGNVALGFVPDYAVRLGIFTLLLLLIGLVWGRLTPSSAMILHGVAALIALIISTVLVRRVLPVDLTTVNSEYRWREWMLINLPLIVAIAMAVLYARVGTILLGSSGADVVQVSFFSVSMRLAAVTAIAQTAMNTTMQPRIAKLYAEGAHDELQDMVTLAVRAVALVALPLGLGLAIFGEFALSIFGADFLPAYPVLLILIIGQTLSTLTGPVGYLLIMTQYEREFALTAIIALIITIGVSIWLIPSYGAVGAAIGSSAGLLFQNILMTIFVYVRLRIWTLPIRLG